MSVSFSALDINISMLLSLLLANIRILSCIFFLFLVIFNNIFIIPFAIEKIKVKLALEIPTGTPTILTNEIIDAPPLVALKIIKILSIYSKIVIYLFNFSIYDFLSLISW